MAVTETAYEPTVANVRVTLAPDPVPPSPNDHAIDAMGDHASTAGHERVTGVPTVAAGSDSPVASGPWVSRVRVSRT